MSTVELKEVFRAFRDQCLWTRACFNTYSDLFESGEETLDLLQRKASVFFHDLNTILIEYCLIQISKHLDPKTTMGRTNLTIEYLNSELEKAQLLNPDIKRLSAELLNYRTLIKDARNRILTHTDRDAVLLNHQFGAHTKEDVLNFFENLQQYCDAVGNSIGEGPSDFRSTSLPGDALDLLRCLRRA